jgi:hypothetical protein
VPASSLANFSDIMPSLASFEAAGFVLDGRDRAEQCCLGRSMIMEPVAVVVRFMQRRSRRPTGESLAFPRQMQLVSKPA